jgi:hypothetical protein
LENYIQALRGGILLGELHTGSLRILLGELEKFSEDSTWY